MRRAADDPREVESAPPSGADRWARLIGAAIGGEHLEAGVRVRFAGSGGLRRELQAFVRFEQAAGSSTCWTIRDAGPGVLTLEATSSDPDEVDRLHALVGPHRSG